MVTMKSLFPIILAGGNGTRLWPASRKSFPKQFANLLGEQSLFQQSFKRVDGIFEGGHPPITVINEEFRFTVREQIEAIDGRKGDIIIEPSALNTAPAILAACLVALETDEEAVVLVTPSDHAIQNEVAFKDAIKIGYEAVLENKIVTFGVVPDEPKTGYGYIEIRQKDKREKEENAAIPGFLPIKRFVEKPDEETAKMMLGTGNFYWNAGIFMARAKDLVAAYERYCPDLLFPVKNAIAKGEYDLGFLRLNADDWQTCPAISIDYAIMEKAENLVVVPFSSRWTDLGDWEAFWEYGERDAQGNALGEGTYSIDCEDVLLRSESNQQVLVGLGVSNLIAVATGDAFLVADKSRSQDVRQIVSLLKQEKKAQAENFPKVSRPWGWYEVITEAPEYQVKKIVVRPQGVISLQQHKLRSEHWVVISGVATMTIDGEVSQLVAGESLFVQQGQKHRIENTADELVILIEVQTGIKISEDDVARIDEPYRRL